MLQTLKQTCFDLWKTNDERKGILPFKPLFIRYIGFVDEDYEHILKTINFNVQRNSDISLLFDGSIPIDFSILQEVEFSDFLLNHMFSESLEYILSIATKVSNYTTFEIAMLKERLCKWTNQYVKKMKFDTNRNPKCIYYGKISTEECYFLMLLYRMTFDVIYINPLEDCELKNLDINHLSECYESEKRIPIDSWDLKIKDANAIACDESYLYQMQNKITNQLFSDGVYKAWQFQNYLTKPITTHCTLIDMENNINEPAKVREGFSVDNHVNIPCFFMKIDGVYQNPINYNKLIYKCNQNKIMERNLSEGFINNSYDLNDLMEIKNAQVGKKIKKGFEIEKLKKLNFYKFSKFRTELQNLILNKINETIIDDVFVDNIDENQILRFVMNVLNIDLEIIKLLDNFDYTSYIPKIIVFLENENTIPNETIMMLGFYHQIGLDIIIFDPSGMTNLENVLNPKNITNVRLDYMKYNLSYEDIQDIEEKKKKFRFFKKH